MEKLTLRILFILLFIPIALLTLPYWIVKGPDARDRILIEVWIDWYIRRKNNQ